MTEPVREPMPPTTTMTTMNTEFRMEPLVKAKEVVVRAPLQQAYRAPVIPAKKAEMVKVSTL